MRASLMRNKFNVIVCLLLLTYGVTLTGCMTANQLAAEQSYYAAKLAMAKQTASQPIFEMIAANNAKPMVLDNVAALRVFHVASGNGSDILNQYVQKDYVQPWLNLLLGIAPWAGVWAVTHEVAGIIGQAAGTTYNQSVTGTGNTATTKVAGTVMNDATSIPTVVYQPPAELIPPVVVNPVIVP